TIVLGAVAAGTGNLTLAASGALSAGTLLSSGSLNASGAAITADDISAHGDTMLGGAINVTDQILGSGNVSITGQSLSAQTLVAGIDFDATNAAGGNIVLGQTGDLTVSVGGGMAPSTVQAAGAIEISAATITADAITGHQDITLSSATGTTTASGRVDISGQVLGGSDISISGSSIKAGAIVSGVDFAATAAANDGIVLANSGDLTLASSGNIDAGTLLSAGDLSASGSAITADNISAHGDMTLGGAISVTDQILGSGNVLITGQSLSAQTLIAGIDFDATDAANGSIVLGQSGDLTVSVSGAASAPTIQAAGAIDVGAASITADAVTGHGDISLSGATAINSQVLGAGNVSISGSSIKAGTVVSGVDFPATAASGGSIVLAGSGDLSLASTGIINAGTLLSAGDLGASGSTIIADNITSHGDVTLGGAISITDQILGAGNVLITGQSLSARTLVAGIDFDATNAGGGNIVLGQTGDLTVSVNGGAAVSTIQAAGAIDVSAASVTADAITGHKDITLSGATDISGQILGGSDVSIAGSSIKAGAIVSGVDFAATAAANGGIVQTSSGNLTLASSGAIDAGTLQSADALSTTGTAVTAGAVIAHGDMILGGAIRVTDQILGAGDISITGQSLSAQTLVAGIDFDATDAAGGNIVLGQTGDLTISVSGVAAASTIQAAGAVDASAATITADAITSHKGIALTGVTGTTAGSGRVDVSVQVLGGSDVSISGSSISAGSVVSGVDFAGTAAANGNIVLAGSGDLTLTASGTLNAATLLSAGDLDVSGGTVTADSVTAHGDITLGGAISVTDQILGSGNVSISGQSLSAQTLVAGIDFDATNAAGGNIVLGQAGDLTVSVNGAMAASTVQAAGAIDVSAASVTADAITGHKDITLSGATGTTTGSGRVDVNAQILGGGDVTISGSAIKAGTIVSSRRMPLPRTAT
ncbi:beta strand repeat-containing protein, partial [Rhizobium leucaenae]|uniref:beta strand repeat-containing protein n=1 Tax=Rhizobium leucaenae TaxID=29450 RepID=UPI0017DB9210|nr:hypothetical protein [Rhizobium leucaenae]